MKIFKFKLLIIIFLIFFGTTAYAVSDLPSINKEIEKQYLLGNKQIVISDGQYRSEKSIVLTKRHNNLSLSANAGKVEIQSSHGGPVFDIRGARNISISGFKLRSIDPNEPLKPIAFFFGSSKVVKNRSIGIRVIDSESIDISYNSVVGYWNGIYISVKNGTCSNVVVKKNNISDCGYWSIAAHYGLKGTIPEGRLKKIQFIDNYVTRCEQGPVFRGVIDSTIEANEVAHNINGLRVERSVKNHIANNVIHHNLKWGIILYGGSSDNLVVNNKIYDNNLQAERIVKIAKKNNMDSTYLPGDLVCFDKYSAKELKPYSKRTKPRRNMPVVNTEYWPYPTAYEHITPGPRFGEATPGDFKKYWGMYFCQFSGVGILLQHKANNNIIKNNEIFNSIPVEMATGYMPYGIRISQTNLVPPIKYASRNNLISGNKISNMVKGDILDDNVRFGIKAGNIY